MKVLITGSSGQIGSELKLLISNYQQYEWFFSNRNQVTLDNLSILESQLKAIQPDIIINCAAYTAVDKAESENDLANTINHLAIGVISKYSNENKVKLIHISTDYVFNGQSATPLKEDDVTDPLNFYGKSKRLGEIACMQNNPNSIIIRTSWLYSEFGNNFVNTMLKLMNEREKISVVNDQIGSPTYALELAETIIKIILFNKWIPGIYNFSNEGETSWFKFAKDIKEIKKINCEIIGILTSEYPTTALRPKYSLLDKSKIKATFGIEIQHYKKSLIKCLGK